MLKMAAVGSLIVFAGGLTSNGATGVMDILDTNTGQWNSTAMGAGSLSEPRWCLATASVETTMLIAGGWYCKQFHYFVAISPDSAAFKPHPVSLRQLTCLTSVAA